MEKMERLLAIWIRDKVERKFPVDTNNIQAKALYFFNHVKANLKDKTEKEESEQFLSSKGWFEKFKKRHEIRSTNLRGEAASADVESAQKFISEFRKIIQEGGYTEDQIINVDETSKFYRQAPTKTFVPNDSVSGKQVSGTKVRKERVTLLLGGNASAL